MANGQWHVIIPKAQKTELRCALISKKSSFYSHI